MDKVRQAGLNGLGSKIFGGLVLSGDGRLVLYTELRQVRCQLTFGRLLVDLLLFFFFLNRGVLLDRSLDALGGFDPLVPGLALRLLVVMDRDTNLMMGDVVLVLRDQVRDWPFLWLLRLSWRHKGIFAVLPPLHLQLDLQNVFCGQTHLFE